MPTERRAWSKEELLVVFRLYCRTPFGRLHQRNPEIIALAELIGRTAGAVAMKACNFASLDPQQQARNVRALGNVSRADRELWESFLNDSELVAQEAEAVYSAMVGRDREDLHSDLSSARKSSDTADLDLSDASTEKETLVKTRRVQSFFRAAVLTSYENRCALTGLAIPELLNASHIVPWSVDAKRRADPRNGICLNALHDRAFDRGLISFDDDLKVVVSPRISESNNNRIQNEFLHKLAGHSLKLPIRFLPSREAIEYHRTVVFRA